MKTPVSFPVTKDTDLYAKWISLTPHDGIYPVTVQTAPDVFASITTGTLTNPAVIEVYGEVWDYGLGKIRDAINNSSVYFKLDMSKVKRTDGYIAS